MDTQVARALDAIVAGDVAALRVLESRSAPELDDLGRSVELVIPAASVARVLDEYSAGMWPDDEVQRWAAFIRWGTVETATGGNLVGVSVDYEAAADNAIADAIGRLDELGDIVDGELRPGEAAELRKALLEHVAADA